MLNKEKDLLILKEQYTQMDAWLSERIRTVLPALMQECEVNLWVVICSEYNEDPVFKTITPGTHADGIPSASMAMARARCLVFTTTRDRCRRVVNCRLRTVLVTRWS